MLHQVRPSFGRYRNRLKLVPAAQQTDTLKQSHELRAFFIYYFSATVPANVIRIRNREDFPGWISYLRMGAFYILTSL